MMALPSCPWNLPRDRPHRAGDGPGPWPGSVPGPWFLARVLPEARCQGWPKAISGGNAKRPNDIEGKHVTIQGPSPDLSPASPFPPSLSCQDLLIRRPVRPVQPVRENP